MKILYKGYDTCTQNKAGGVRNRILKTEELIRARGFETELFGEFTSTVSECDILHMFMLHYQNDQLVRCAKQQGKKIVLSSIINCENGHTIDFHRRIGNRLPIGTIASINFKILSLVDRVIAETETEKRFLHDHWGVPLSKTIVIPNGVDPVDCDNIGVEIDQYLDHRQKYVLVVGRFDENKNQLNMIRALKDTDIQLVFIGGADHTRTDYYTICQREAEGHDNIHFLGWVEHDDPLLKSAYYWADTVAVPSYQETFGLIVLEAGMMGAKLCLSKTLPILEYNFLEPDAQFDPWKPESIRETIINVMGRKKDMLLRERLIQLFSWETVSEQLASVYEELGKNLYEN